MSKHFLILFFALNSIVHVFGQMEIRKITPISPDAAAIAKYGEIPVGYFTGIPDINIPIYGIKSRELELPLSISYHAGGNKVEDIASWTGLGWSLGSIPCITRSVRGIEDESAGGFLSLFSGKTVQQIYDDRFSTNGQVTYASYLDGVRNGTVDPEADIYFFSLAGKSGKFYYNQATQSFYCTPFENIKITQITNGFRITSDDGTIYDFNVKEFATSNLNQSTNSWWASKMVNANRTDSITFEYTTQTETFTTLSSVTKSIYVSGSSTCQFPSYESSSSVNIITSIKPFRINFSGGYVKFFAMSTERADLAGGKALDRIEVYNYLNKLVKKVRFQYIYHQNATCSNSPDCFRLILDKVWEETASGQQSAPHLFSYNNSILLPNRLSTGQDYWGYSNGHTENGDLIPGVIYQESGILKKLVGANRLVNPDETQFSILNKITYPTGGTTEFEYENNWVNEPTLPIKTTETTQLLSGNGTGTSSYALFEKNFTINVPPNIDLNGNNGGAFLKVIINNLGCDISGGANLCANLKIVGLTNGYNSGSILTNLDALYIPNGDYKMSAEFNQSPPLYQNFIFGITWEKADSAFIGNRLAGGVRIKSIINFDGISHTYDTKKYFKYLSDSSVNISSGLIFGLPYLNFSEFYAFNKYYTTQEGCSFCTVNLLKRSSYSNITAVSQSGSFVGYSNIVLQEGSNAENGKTVYKFSNDKDMASSTFPYPPSQSNEHKRGLLIENTYFKKVGNNFYPVNRVKNTYGSFINSSINNSLSFSLKISPKDVISNQCGPMNAFPILYVSPYDIKSNKVLLLKTESYQFNSDDSTKYLKDETFYDYDATYLLQNNVKSYNSKGDSIYLITKYVNDLALVGIPETARQKLIVQNRIITPLQSIKQKNFIQKELIQTNYKEFYAGIVFPETIEYQTASNPKEVRVKSNSYDNYGNLLEQQKVNDVKEVYLWGYNSLYPVAKVLNTTSDIAKTYVTQSILDNPLDDATLRQHLSNLKNIPGAIVTTYTYKPLIGLTSQTDPNGNITFYEYDDFNRLTLVKDQNNNVVKKICYNYSGQAENCQTIELPTTIYARIEYSDWFNDLNSSYATVWIKLYSDLACTTPVTATNLTVNYQRIKTFCNANVVTTNLSATFTGNQFSLGSQKIYSGGINLNCYNLDFIILPGTGYTENNPN